jgi:fructan beta-fructosidase
MHGTTFLSTFAILVFALLFAASLATDAQGQSPALYHEQYRPQIHFTPAENWMNDPNGMVYYDGEYHLFYQYNPFGVQWGHMSWGHAVSRDLVHWEQLPVALAEENGVMIFSGSAVVDWHNTSGFGKNGKPPLVAIYTGHYTEKPLQNQQIAYSNDRGRTWTKYAGNPVLDIGEKDFRDPKVFWHEPTHHWIMTVSLPVQRKIRFYSSHNLKEWTHLSDFGPAGVVKGIWECPDLFPMSVEGKTKWALIVNVGSDAPAGGSGSQYFVGDFDGATFTLDHTTYNGASLLVSETNAPHPAAPPDESALWLDYGPDFYAAVSWSDAPHPNGRRLIIGWMSNWQYANDVPTVPWRSAMSLPRELVLRKTSAGYRLFQQPVAGLEKLRGLHQRFAGGTVQEVNAWLRQHGIGSAPFEMAFECEAPPEGAIGVKLFQGDKEETVVGVNGGRSNAYVDRTHSGNIAFNPTFSRLPFAPLDLTNRRVKVHLFVDSGSVEVFINGGEHAITALTLPSPTSRGMEFFGPNSDVRIGTIDLWSLGSIWK